MISFCVPSTVGGRDRCSEVRSSNMTSSDVTWIEISLHSIIIDHLILNHVKKIKMTSESIIFMVYYWYGLFSQYINLIHLRLFFSDRIPLKNPFLVQSLIEDIAFVYLFIFWSLLFCAYFLLGNKKKYLKCYP